MKRYSTAEIAKIINGQLFQTEQPEYNTIDKITIDSRTISEFHNSMFFALISHRNDGHHYLKNAWNKGIRVFVISQLPPDFISFKNSIFIKVANTLTALQKLAAFKRSGFSKEIIAITGSNGKTIVKEWLYDLLRGHFLITRSPKSYNSQVGVPLSVWLLEEKHTLGIFEAGISLPGEMEKLAQIIQPEIGIFTNIGPSHQENFDTVEQKIREKIKLFRNTKKLVFCSDQAKTFNIIHPFCQQNNIDEFKWSLTNKNSPIYIVPFKGESTTAFEANYKGHSYKFTIPFTDDSSIENACQCFAAILALNLNPQQFLTKFKTLSSVAMRLEIKQGINNSLLINDYYNSDINSLSIALSVMENQAKKSHLQKVVILSDIRQSGETPIELYSHVNQLLKKSGINKLIGIGADIFSNSEIFEFDKLMFRTTDDFLKSIDKSNFSNSAVLIKGARAFNFEAISSALQEKAHQTVLEINLNALVSNLNTFKSLLKPTTKIMAMVKAFSYGSGTAEIANILQFHQIDYLAVAVADEGIELRKAGITTPIVVMNPEFYSFQNIIDYNLQPNIYSFSLFESFNKTLKQNAILNFPIHIKIETGMNRLGFKGDEEINLLIKQIKKDNTIKIKSVFSHLAGADDAEFDNFTLSQIKTFEKISQFILAEFEYKIDRHILNSAGIERFPNFQFEMVRLGIGLYGVSSSDQNLQAIGTLQTTISQIKNVTKKETIGYSRKGKINKPTQIAIIPIGYADGLNRGLGNLKGRVFINGNYAPIIGNICMDMCMLDVSGIAAKVGDKVEIFGEHVPISEIAQKLNTIPYEILTSISQRVKRIYLQE